MHKVNLNNLLVTKLNKLSYFNAAEGSYSRETTAREKCKSDIKRVVALMRKEGTSLLDILQLQYDNSGLTKVSDLFDENKTVAFRLVQTDDNGESYKTLFHGINGSRTIPANTKQYAEIKYKHDGSNKKFYNTGFHSIETEELLYKYLKSFKTRRNKLRIGIVVVEGLFCKPNSKQGVILSQSQELIEVRDINWTNVG